ncbi:MAG: hypothetical protein M0Z38_04720 [Deltaproteobacteria bacterium]|nr:hypothetical protein [Deltaproteobacteria bacterium]
MNRHIAIVRTVSFLVAVAFLLATAAAVAGEQKEIKMMGIFVKQTMAADGKSAEAVVKDVKTGKEVTLILTDDLTLNKFRKTNPSWFLPGEEIRIKYVVKDGKNQCTYFRKAAGC